MYTAAVIGLAALLGFVGGLLAAAVILARGRRMRSMMIAFRPRPLAHAGGDPYRGEVARPAGPPLDEVIRAVRGAGLTVTPHARGFDVRGAGNRVRVRVQDPAHVALAALDIFDDEHETLGFALAVALVPLYGPIVVTEALWGSYTVDGSRDQAALRDERGERIKEMARQIQQRLQASQDVWNKLGARR